MKKKVLIKAPMLSRSGYGEHARFVLRALRSKEELFDIYILNIRWGDTGWIWENNEERQYIDEAIKKTVLTLEGAKKAGQQVHFDVSLQVTIPQEWEKLAAVNIGCTAGTETTKMSPQWVEKSNLMDKILVVSEHTKYAFDNTVYKFQHPQTGQEIVFRNETPVEVTHYPVRKVAPCPKFLELDFKHDFNFLCNAQWSPRKNLENTVRWWLEEFQDKPYGLILKGNFAKNCVMDREKFEQRINHILKDFEERECSVYYLHGDLTEEELSALYQHQKVKCFINLAHGEGFGLPVFEAAYYGLPVIAPDWGGVVDFLYAPDDKGKKKAHFLKVDYDLKPVQEEAVWEPVLIKDSLWAFPKRFSYVSRLRDAVKMYGIYHAKAKRLRKWLLKEFKKESKEQRLAESVVRMFFGSTEDIDPKPVNKVSFIISTNGEKQEKTKRLVKSIRRTVKDSPHEIIVSGTTHFIEDVIKVDAKEDADNGMLAKLRDLGSEVATGDILLFVDDDFIFPEGWYERFKEFSRKNGWHVLSNKILLPDGSRFWDRATKIPHKLTSYDHFDRDKNLYNTGGFWIVRDYVYDNVKWDVTLPINAGRIGLVNEDIKMSEDIFKAGYWLSFDKENYVWHNDDSYIEFGEQTLKKQMARQLGLAWEPPMDNKYKKDTFNL